ncbi:VOC family protein [Paenibacillus donghaensis]|nr:VOC family protein [Paenibacillus donghaensis]
MNMLGVDNIFLQVGDLALALAHYVDGLGFELKWKMEDKGMAILKIGEETPGLIIRVNPAAGNAGSTAAASFWVEVSDAAEAANELEQRGITLNGPPFQIGTGWVVEAADPWGNVVGFTDYLLRPQLGRLSGQG